MKVGIIGRGAWGMTLRRNIEALGHEVAWQEGRSLVEGKGRPLFYETVKPMDAVFIATPPDLHAELVLDSLAVKKDLRVWVEKPMGTTLLDCQRLEGLLAVEPSPYVFVDHTRLWYPRLEANRDITIGGPGPFRLDTNALWDWGPHAAAYAIHLHGDCTVLGVTIETGTYRVRLAAADGTPLYLTFGNTFSEKLDTVVSPSEGEPPLTAALRSFFESPTVDHRASVAFGGRVVKMLSAIESLL